jgi:hypothetical protein
MKNPLDVLQAKEKELMQVKKEIEALCRVLPLLGEETEAMLPPPGTHSIPAPRVRQLP